MRAALRGGFFHAYLRKGLMLGEKACSKCKVVKPLSEFTRAKNVKDGHYSQCRHCKNDLIRERRQRTGTHTEKLRLKYNIDEETYNMLFEAQDKVCAICRNPCSSGRRLAIDHWHGCCPGATSCGDCIRGLLCTRCNAGLGLFQDDVEFLREAISYLERTATIA